MCFPVGPRRYGRASKLQIALLPDVMPAAGPAEMRQLTVWACSSCRSGGGPGGATDEKAPNPAVRTGKTFPTTLAPVAALLAAALLIVALCAWRSGPCLPPLLPAVHGQEARAVVAGATAAALLHARTALDWVEAAAAELLGAPCELAAAGAG